MYGISVLKKMVTLLTIFERNEPISAEEASLAIHTMYLLVAEFTSEFDYRSVEKIHNSVNLRSEFNSNFGVVKSPKK